jgi:ABC-type proline/glycine betaine transport system permease subunit
MTKLVPLTVVIGPEAIGVLLAVVVFVLEDTTEVVTGFAVVVSTFPVVELIAFAVVLASFELLVTASVTWSW